MGGGNLTAVVQVRFVSVHDLYSHLKNSGFDFVLSGYDFVLKGCRFSRAVSVAN
jgi:hypothetical protein